MILSNILKALIELIHMLLTIYMLIIIVRSVMSWMGNVPPNAFTYLLRRLTDPVFRWVHRHLPFTIIGGIDISPLFILMGLYFIDNVLMGILSDMAVKSRSFPVQ
ncbi:MAG: YggT family protein [bacterium]|nr:YggT family protein [bacterium]